MTRMTDKEEIEMIRDWWNEYGKAIATAVLIGLVLGFGWRYWNVYHARQSEQASMVYQDMVVSDISNDILTTQRMAAQLTTKYSSTPYASFAQLLLAKESIAHNDLNSAYQQLLWVVDQGKVASIRQIARLRAARVLLAQKKLDEALQLISKVDDVTFMPLINSVKGDIFAAKGDLVSAKKYYQTALSALAREGIQDPILAMKAAQ